MPNHVLLVLANPTEGNEDEFNRWYDEEHLSYMLENTPGLVSARRFVLSELPGSPPSEHKYLAVYEVADGQVEQLVAGLFGPSAAPPAAPADGSSSPALSPAMDLAGARVALFSPIGPAVTTA